jgi:hypothetical protein
MSRRSSLHSSLCLTAWSADCSVDFAVASSRSPSPERFVRPSASLCRIFRRRSVSPSIPVFPCRVPTPSLSPSRERLVPQPALGSLPCPTLTSGTPRAVVTGFPTLTKPHSRVLDLFEVARHSLLFSGSPPGSLRCAVHSRSAARGRLRFGKETPFSSHVPPAWSLTTSAACSATYRSEDRVVRAPKSTASDVRRHLSSPASQHIEPKLDSRSSAGHIVSGLLHPDFPPGVRCISLRALALTNTIRVP